MKKKNIISVCLVFLLVVGFASIASAYSLWTYGYADPDIDYESSGVGSIYLDAMSDAKYEWNHVNVPCSVSSSDASYNYLYTFTSGAYYGLYESLAQSNDDPQHRTTWFRIGMNSILFPNMSETERQSVCVHELGHAMGLYDLSSGTAIMSTNRDRSTIYSPRLDDIYGVNASW